ncbi:MAG: hypothetical protein ACI8XO_000589 [Verrucomicrobiales bacterium]|jgi:hypothetical protein
MVNEIRPPNVPKIFAFIEFSHLRHSICHLDLQIAFHDEFVAPISDLYFGSPTETSLNFGFSISLTVNADDTRQASPCGMSEDFDAPGTFLSGRAFVLSGRQDQPPSRLRGQSTRPPALAKKRHSR